MNDQTDAQLLAAWARTRLEPAFAELVRRYVDLVHSAALRMVCDADLAKDVTQGVFVALAKDAGRIRDCRVLAGWLHRTAQNIAAQTVRTEVRRRVREQEAATMNELLGTESEAPWENIAPYLDGALGELSEPDRDVVLLRYFENKSLREVGQALGTSDDTAQKRVSRAVERLREFLAKRGVAVGASGLGVIISTHAVQAAPVGLAGAISTTAVFAGSTIATATTATAVKTIAMTTLQKTFVTATIAVLAGVGIYEARKNSTLREENDSLQQQVGQLKSENDNFSNRLARLENTPSPSGEALPEKQFNELLRLRGVVAAARRENEEVRRAASAGGVVDSSTTNANSLDQIIKVLRDTDPSEAGDDRRYKAAEQLKGLGSQAVKGLPVFRELLRSGNQETRYAGARAMAMISRVSPEAFQELNRALSDPDKGVRDAATHGVSLLFDPEFQNVDAGSTLPILVQNLRDPYQVVRSDTAIALLNFIQDQKRKGRSSEPALIIPALTQNLEDPYRYARYHAVLGLQEYGDAAKSAIPQLRKLLQDSDPSVRGAAIQALERISKGSSTSN